MTLPSLVIAGDGQADRPAYPYLVFHVVQEAHDDVWRVLHGRRDIPRWMQNPDEA